jgi:hypothetical protein
MKTTETIDLTPTWEACVRIYCTVLRNPKSSEESVELAEAELLRLAKHVDQQKKK